MLLFLLLLLLLLRYASHLGLPAITTRLSGRHHTNLSRLLSNHLSKGAGFQIWVQVWILLLLLLILLYYSCSYLYYYSCSYCYKSCSCCCYYSCSYFCYTPFS